MVFFVFEFYDNLKFLILLCVSFYFFFVAKIFFFYLHWAFKFPFSVILVIMYFILFLVVIIVILIFRHDLFNLNVYCFIHYVLLRRKFCFFFIYDLRIRRRPNTVNFPVTNHKYKIRRTDYCIGRQCSYKI